MKQRALQVGHYVAAGVHAASFIVQLVLCIVFADRLFNVELTIQRDGWESLGSYPVAWLILSFAPITAAFHVWEARKRVLKQVHRDGANGWRWLEYSITAGIMTWAVAQASGATDVNTLILLLFANVGMQLAGYAMERRNADLEWVGPAPSRAIDWWPFVAGSVLFVGIWYIIGYYFFTAIAVAGASNVPWFVYAVFFGLLVQFAGFAVVMAFHYVSPPPPKPEVVARGDLLLEDIKADRNDYMLLRNGRELDLRLRPLPAAEGEGLYALLDPKQVDKDLEELEEEEGDEEEDKKLVTSRRKNKIVWIEQQPADGSLRVMTQGEPRWFGLDLRDARQYEMAWIVLSLVSKLYLEWITLGGAIGR